MVSVSGSLYRSADSSETSVSLLASGNRCMPDRTLFGLIRRLLGNRGERAAGRFLRKKGMRILARQYATRWGEIDLIALDRDCVVFVEVKTRSSAETNHPSEAIDAKKRLHVTKAAFAWLQRNRLLEHRARFDVVTLVWPPGENAPRIEHFMNAFEAVDYGQFS